MDEIKREMTFEEEAGLYRTEAGWILAEEKPGAEPPFVNNVLRRGLRLIKLALERIDFLKLDVDYYKLKLENLPQNGWISVKDRLPDVEGFYLTYTPDGNWSGVLHYSVKYQAFNTYDTLTPEEAQVVKLTDITHWMPLPEPPKEDEDAKAD